MKIKAITILPDWIKSSAKLYLVYKLIKNFNSMIVSTYIILFFILNFGFIKVGYLFSLYLTITMLVDYPTAALSDIIGQKNVMVTAKITSLASLFGFLIFQNTLGATIYFVFSSISSSQESGALDSWLDLQLKEGIEHEDNKDEVYKNYGHFFGDTRYLIDLIEVGALLISSVIVYFFDIYSLFIVLIITVTVSLSVIYRMKPRTKKKDSLKFKSYIRQLFKPLQFYRSNKWFASFMFFELVIFALFGTVWGSLILLPLYDYILPSKESIGVFRSILVITGIFSAKIGAWLAKKLNIRQMMIVGHILGYSIYGFLIFVMSKGMSTQIYKLSNFNYLVRILLYIVIWQLPLIFPILIFVALRQLYIKILPDEARNSIYSFQATMVSLIAIPLIFFFSWYLDGYGLISSLNVFWIITSIAMLPILYISYTKLGVYSNNQDSNSPS